MADDSNKNVDNEKIQHYVDALVNIPTSGHDSAHISRRIIYFKDFGSITRIAQPLLGFFLRALLKLNDNGSSATEDHSPVILVFGISSCIKLISGKDDEFDDNSQWHDAIPSSNFAQNRILLFPVVPIICSVFPSKSLPLIRSSIQLLR